MSVGSLSGVLGGTSGTTSAAQTDAAGIAENFDAFLQLLTTQLKNQNPLEPMDTNEFTNQLVQFSSVEQTIKTNQNLENLINVTSSNSAAAIVSFIGKTVSAAGASTNLKDGTAKWDYNLSDDAENSLVTIRDNLGEIVHSEQLSLDAGKGSYEWDGTNLTGGESPEGVYTITIDAKKTDDSTVQVDTTVTGVVDGVDFSKSDPVLNVGGVLVSLSSIKEVKTTTSG